MEEKKSNHLAARIICGILTTFGIVACIISLANGAKGIWIVSDVVCLLVSVFVGYYAFSGYKKPHGNILKYLILVFTLIPLINIYQLVQLENAWVAVTRAIIVGLLCYSAGRLHRVKQNIVIMSIVTALMILGVVVGFMNGHNTIGALTKPIIWINIFAAYVLRYKDHKEAGLMDAPTE